MKICAIISEYNPFHNGHKYQIEKAREITNCDGVIALMSGNVVQRGDFAIFDKKTRAKAALNGGIDLILENPTQAVLQSAEGYAYSAIYTLTSLNCVDFLIFGAEHSSLSDLYAIAELLAFEDNEFKTVLANALKDGTPFAKARGIAVSKFLGKNAEEILRQPNNLLAIEYLKALIKQNSPIKPVLIKRQAVNHNSMTSKDEFASATLIREKLLEHSDISPFVPDESFYADKKPFDIKKLEKSIISCFALMSTQAIRSLPDVSEGLENKIKTAVLASSTLEQMLSLIKSKRYTHSRLRRIILSGFLGITKNSLLKEPPYIKILDFNENGRKILNAAKKTALIPLCKNATPLLKNQTAMQIWKRELEFEKVYEIFSKI